MPDDCYCIHNQLAELLNVHAKQSKNLFFARFLLPNKSNESDMFYYSLKLIDRQDYLKVNAIDDKLCLRLNTIYQIS